MYAIVDIAGKQFKVEEGNYVYSNTLDAESGKKVEFENVLLLDENGKVSVGAPTVKGAKVTGKVVEHLRDDKVLVFKKKRRKGYKKKNGHRQPLTKVLIEKISK